MYLDEHLAQVLPQLCVTTNQLGGLANLQPFRLTHSDVLSCAAVQVELRVLAQLSGDAALKAEFAARRDVHEATARQLLGKQHGVGR